MTEFVTAALLVLIVFAMGLIFGSIFTLFTAGYQKQQRRPVHRSDRRYETECEDPEDDVE